MQLNAPASSGTGSHQQQMLINDLVISFMAVHDHTDAILAIYHFKLG